MPKEQQLPQRQSLKAIGDIWIIFFGFLTILIFLWQKNTFIGWTLLPLILTLIVCIQKWHVYAKNQKLQRIDSIDIAPIFWQVFMQRYPHTDIRSRRLIEQGFKDFLALHVIHKQGYAMPSAAVDALWHIMLEHPEHYQILCKKTVGRVIEHRPYVVSTSATEQCTQQFNTWQMSCILHGFKATRVEQLPRLFAVDQVLNWQDGHVYDLQKLNADFTTYLKSQSSSSCGSGSSSCGSSCSSCGGD